MLAKEHADIADAIKLRNSRLETSGSNYDNVYEHTVENLISTSAYLKTLLTRVAPESVRMWLAHILNIHPRITRANTTPQSLDAEDG